MSVPKAIAAVRELQKQRAITLYRQSLKNVLSWSVHRDIFYKQAGKLRDEFEANRDLDGVARIERALQAGEERLAKFLHPDPYTIPWAPGGSKYVRNPPVPEEIQIVFDFGRESQNH